MRYEAMNVTRRTAVMLAVTLSACSGDDPSGSGEDDGSTSGTGGSSDGVVEDSSTTSEGSTSGDPTTGDGSTGGQIGPAPETDVFYTSAESGVRRLYAASLDLARVQTLTSGVGNVDITPETLAPRLDADHLRVAFGRHDELWVGDSQMGASQISSQEVGILRFAWSPASDRIAWHGERAKIFTEAPDGSDAVEVADLAGDSLALADIEWIWSPDGDRFAVRSQPDGDFQEKVWMVDADGSNPGVVSGAMVGAPTKMAFSPTGHLLAYVANENEPIPGRELYVGDRDGAIMVSNTGGTVGTFAWSPDASKLAYVSDGGAYIVGEDGNDHQSLDDVAPNAADTVLSWSSDGSTVAWRDTDHLRLSSVDGSVHVDLVDGAGDLDVAAFEPDGSRIAYTTSAEADGPLQLKTSSIDGQTVVATHALSGSESVGSWVWNGGELLYAVEDDTGLVGVFHTASGDVNLLAPEGAETGATIHLDDDVFVVRTETPDAQQRLCGFWLADQSPALPQGCSSVELDDADVVLVARHP